MTAKHRIAALDWPRRFAEYSAGELARICGMSPEMQRLWRQRGYLPEVQSARARFSPTDVAEIIIRHALSRHGIPPSESATIDPDAAKGALYHAIINHQGSCEIIGPAGDVNAFLRDYELEDFALELAESPLRSNYLVWDDEKTMRMVDDVHELFDEQALAIAAIDLRVVGARIMERGRKPIVTLESPLTAGLKRIRGLNGVVADALVTDQ